MSAKTSLGVGGSSPYTFKPEPFSSHSLLLRCFLAQGQPRRVIDIGGGEGYLSRALAERGFQVVCIAAPGSVAPGGPAGIEFIEADLDFELPNLEGTFDYALCGDVLEHLRDPSRTLHWIRDLLVPAGKLVASLPNSGHAYFRANVLLGRFPKHDRGLFDRTHLQFYTWQGWQQLLKGCGFEIEKVEPTAVPFGLLLGRWRDTLVAASLERVSYGLARLWKTLFAYQFVVVARPDEKG